MIQVFPHTDNTWNTHRAGTANTVIIATVKVNYEERFFFVFFFTDVSSQIHEVSWMCMYESRCQYETTTKATVVDCWIIVKNIFERILL